MPFQQFKMRMRHTERLRAETHNFYPQRNLYLMNHLRSGRGGGEEAGEAQHRAAALSVAAAVVGVEKGERRRTEWLLASPRRLTKQCAVEGPKPGTGLMLDCLSKAQDLYKELGNFSACEIFASFYKPFGRDQYCLFSDGHFFCRPSN
jgi:hypothetical protein